MGGYLCAGKEIRISLDPGDDLTQDDAVGEHVRLQTDEQMHLMNLCISATTIQQVEAKLTQVEFWQQLRDPAEVKSSGVTFSLYTSSLSTSGAIQ